MKRQRMKVFLKAEYLIGYTFQMTDNNKRYSKKYTFTFVNRMQNLTLDIYTNLIKANQMPLNERKKLQYQVISDLEVLLVLIELSLERKLIDYRQCKIWIGKVMDVKNLTGAWLKISK